MGRDCHRVGGHGGDGGGGVKSKIKANGCMAAFYHLFDFPSHHNLTIYSPSRSKGLKLIQESPPSITYKEKQTLNIPVSIRVRALATDTSSSSSEICNSPGSKTPNLVARLMGLDLLPEKTNLNHSLSDLHTMSRLTSHTLFKKGTRLGTRSLPESPRISSDFDIHRLSLQLNRESKHEEENLSARDYARQRVKQTKERVVTRRVCGMDITNSVKKRASQRRDITVSCSPRTRISDKENKPSTIHKSNSASSFRPEQMTKKPKLKPTKVILVPEQNQKRVKQRELRPINQCKKSKSEIRFKPQIRNNLPEVFLSESRKTKINNHLNKKRLKNTPNLNNDIDNISATEPPQKQINETQAPKSFDDASTFFSLINKIDDNNLQAVRNYKMDDAATVYAEGIVTDSERQYITRIMKLAGINTATMVHPSVFLKLEDSRENQSGSLALRCNRRMLFDLVNEALIRRSEYHVTDVIGELCSAVERYSEKSSSIPGDVNSVVEMKKLEEEIIGEIERDIVEALLRETAFETTSDAKLNYLY